MGNPLQDFSGQKFEMALVVSRADSRSGTVWWNCLCDCGKEFQASSKRIRRNMLRNCGCEKQFRGIKVPEGMQACEVASTNYPNGRTGTSAGYQAHLKNNEGPCDKCYHAHSKKCLDYYGGLTEDQLEARRVANRTDVRNYAAKYPDRVKDSSLSFRDTNRQIIREAKDIPCADCGVAHPHYVMQFDHVQGVKEFNIGPVGPTVSRDRLLAEISKCEVVCANCHSERTYTRRLEEEVVDSA